MISREPTIERLATAQRLLLEPFGLNESNLSRALGEISAHKVDD
ncbi:MAG: peptidase U62, partial [Pseudomonadota bacterium]|nr:peptidase U62 [Pseudomonadota bacterium]